MEPTKPQAWPGQLVLCADGTLVTWELRDLTVVDRGCSMFRGQTVTSASDPEGQVGVVTGVHTELDLIQLNGAVREEEAAAEPGPPVVVARGVSPGELRRVREL